MRSLLSELEAIVGKEYVSEEKAELYTPRCALNGYIKPICVVEPGEVGEVRELVKWAKATKVPLVPCSSGPPHLKGGAFPTVPGAVIVDLKRLNKVVRVDREHRVVLIEAGVTYELLIPELERNGLILNLPLLPRRTKSVVASVLDRDPPTMPKYQWDISDPLACLEVVFGTGDVFRTGQAAGPGDLKEQWAVGAAQKVPYGPGIASWHRLIQGSQGTIGIVTWASIRCEVKPVIEEPFFVTSADLVHLMELAYWLVRLRIPTYVFILNSVDLAAIYGEHTKFYPDLPRWTLFFVLAGGEYFPEERIRAYKEELEPIIQKLGLSLERAVGPFSAFDLLKMLKHPSDEVPWKLKQKGSFYDLTFLAKYDSVYKIVYDIQKVSLKAGYPPEDIGVYIQPIVQGTSYYCELTFFVDLREQIGRKIAEIIDEMAMQVVTAHKGYFIRPYGRIEKSVCSQNAQVRQLFRELKRIFDPFSIMNPGRLFFD